jgi:hypothetical protein
MQTQYRKMLCILAFAAVALTLSATKSAAQSHDREDDGKTLEGTWVTEVTLVDCQSHQPAAPPFISLGTFARGGAFTETTSSPLFFPAQRTSGHGVWIRTGRRTYKASSMALITLNGTLVRTQTITQMIEMKSPDQFVTTSASVEFFNPDGSRISSSGCATAVSTRFEFRT